MTMQFQQIIALPLHAQISSETLGKTHKSILYNQFKMCALADADDVLSSAEARVMN